MTRRFGLAVLLGVGVGLFAAGCAPEPQIDKDLIRTPSGLQYKDLKVGEGKAAETGDTVEVHYTGRLTNGKEFDSSIGKAAVRLLARRGAGHQGLG